jgi:hypothetical protein
VLIEDGRVASKSSSAIRLVNSTDLNAELEIDQTLTKLIHSANNANKAKFFNENIYRFLASGDGKAPPS